MNTRRDFLRQGLAVGMVVGAGGLLTACGSSDSESSDTSAGAGAKAGDQDAELSKLTAMMPFPLYLAFFADCAAKSAGYMADNGIDLDLQFARSAPQAIQQLAAGNVDVIRNAPIGLVKAVSQEDAPFVSIATVNQRIIYNVLSSKSAPLPELGDLAGKTVGLATLAGNAENTLDFVLKAAKVDPSSVKREAVGNEAASFEMIKAGRIDGVFATHEATATIMESEPDAYLNDLGDKTNPLLGTSIVASRETIETRRDDLIGYLRAMKKSLDTVLDGGPELDAVIPKVRKDWDLPQLDDPKTAIPVIQGVGKMWLAAGRENLLVNVPERWDEGIEGFIEQKIAKKGSKATDFYTNDLIDEALS
ncbi:MAG TPA: ABC transporter substrate-binding protein [Acidimicrobiales bacterium]|nr:ABC transporter substrate-binding protein [Acidimicrobiales bacterium]